MSRAERLLKLMQSLRRRHYPVPGAELAAEHGISLRTLYRDIASLQAQGARIDGEPGIGYLLRPGFTLPPMMLSEDELEALVLGSRWVADRADSELGQAARDALAKIAAVLPPEMHDRFEASALLVGPGQAIAAGDQELATIRHAMRAGRKLDIVYRDLKDRESRRIIWPFALGFFDHASVLAGWCESRQQFRHFRTDRILALTMLEARYPRHRQALLNEWRKVQNITTDRN